MKVYVAVGIGGVIGSSLRFLVSSLCKAEGFSAFPWATFIVNISGAFLLTFILFLPSIEKRFSPTILTALTTGVIGSYTTFSAITIEVVLVWQNSVITALLYLILTIFGGLFCSYIGYKIARSYRKDGLTK